MNWSKEFWRKFYTRRTDEDLLLSWEARAVWHEMIRTFDDTGTIKTRRGAQGLAALIRVPVDVVERSLVELEDCGRVMRGEECYFAPNFVEAQGTKTSGAVRQKMYRGRHQNGNVQNNEVTRGDSTLPAVTARDDQKERQKDRQTERVTAPLFSRRRFPEDPNCFMLFDENGQYVKSVRIENDGSETEIRA